MLSMSCCVVTQGQSEKEETFALSISNNLPDAVAKVTAFLGMHACDNSGVVNADKNTHTLFLAVLLRSLSPPLQTSLTICCTYIVG